MKYKISIIIPIHNIEKYLEHTLDSLLKQTIGPENLEVIMVNDYSTDRSEKIIDKYVDKYENFRAIHLPKNFGLPGKPRNIGLEKAKGEYVMFMDHDDTYSNNTCEIFYNKINNNDVDMLFSRYYSVFKNNIKKKNPSQFEDVDEININNIDEDTRFLNLSPSLWTKIFKRNFLIDNNIKFPEGMLAEDLSFIVNCLLKANGITYLNNFFSYNYRIRDSDAEKSTIHVRNKKYLMAMIDGYYDTYSTIKKFDREEYFALIFQSHLDYWMNSFILSDAKVYDKIELLKKIRFLYDKFEKSNSELKLNNKYRFLIDYMLKEEFYEAVMLAEIMSKYEKKEIKLQNQLADRKKQVAHLQTLKGWLKYKIKNIMWRLRKKFN